MTPQQITLVQDSFKKVKPISDMTAQLFYGRLFEMAPQVKPLFKETDIKKQGRKLMQTLAFVSASLTKPETLLPAVQALGKSHVNYGVKDEHYPLVEAALLWALEEALSHDFTPEVREAWGEAYSMLATVMQDAAAS